MAGLDPAIQDDCQGLCMLPWMAASEGGHGVKRYDHWARTGTCGACLFFLREEIVEWSLV
jgi:hypothetical protein